jgi:thioredoxin 2
MTSSAPPYRRPVTVRCPFCSRLNRVDLARLADGPRCAECSKPIRLDRPLQATEADFDETIRTASVPVLVDFYADWCGPCKVMAPILDEFAQARAGEVLVLKVDTDRNPTLAGRQGIRGIPTLVAFRNGQETRRVSGVTQRAVLDSLAGQA